MYKRFKKEIQIFTNEMNSINYSFKNIINQIKHIVINDRRSISYTYVSNRFGLRVDLARNLLKEFVNEHNKDGLYISVKYFLFGVCYDKKNDQNFERIKIVDENNLHSTRKLFNKIEFEDIYSVSFVDVPKNELNFLDYEIEVTNASELEFVQSLTFKRNNNIGFRMFKIRQPQCEKIETPFNDINEVNKKHFTINSNYKRNNDINNVFSKVPKKLKNETESKLQNSQELKNKVNLNNNYFNFNFKNISDKRQNTQFDNEMFNAKRICLSKNLEDKSLNVKGIYFKHKVNVNSENQNISNFKDENPKILKQLSIKSFFKQKQ